MRFIFLLSAAVLTAVPAGAIDLTGTWVGSFKCSSFDTGFKYKFSEKDQTLLITQVGNVVNVEWSDTTAALAGIAIPDAKKPDEKGAAAIIECDTTTDLTTGHGELANLQVKVKRDKGKGSLKGTSVYTGADVGASWVGLCKWNFKLVSPADPGVSGCP